MDSSCEKSLSGSRIAHQQDAGIGRGHLGRFLQQLAHRSGGSDDALLTLEFGAKGAVKATAQTLALTTLVAMEM